jgi:hypothetical protein
VIGKFLFRVIFGFRGDRQKVFGFDYPTRKESGVLFACSSFRGKSLLEDLAVIASVFQAREPKLELI